MWESGGEECFGVDWNGLKVDLQGSRIEFRVQLTVARGVVWPNSEDAARPRLGSKQVPTSAAQTIIVPQLTKSLTKTGRCALSVSLCVFVLRARAVSQLQGIALFRSNSFLFDTLYIATQ